MSEEKKDKTEERIINILNKVRPQLQMDGGDVQFVSWSAKTGIVSVQLTGACVGCPMSAITLKQGIEEEMKKEIPEVKSVENV